MSPRPTVSARRLRPRPAAAALVLGVSVLLGAALLGPGCADDDELAGGGPIVPSAGGGGGQPDAGPGGSSAKRTVEQRNPFGNVAKVHNLLWDGDFEWTWPFSDQYGWLTGSSTGSLSYALPDIVVGPQCRSGLKCAALEPGHIVMGLGVGSRDQALCATFDARPADGSCENVLAVFLTWDPTEIEIQLHPDSPVPDESGWCHFGALAGSRQGGTLLYIENTSEQPMLVDDAVIEPVDGQQALQAQALSPALRQRLGPLRRAARKALEPRDRPTPHALREFRRKITRRRSR